MEATASGNSRINQAGRDQVINETVLPEAALRRVIEVTASPRLVYLPRHTRTFVGRSDELATLEEALHGGVRWWWPRCTAWAGSASPRWPRNTRWRRPQDVVQQGDAAGGLNPVWWITADSDDAVQAGLAGLALALQPELATVLPMKALVERATAWLAAHVGWLLVLDNVVDVAGVRPLLERTLTGQVLVTSRLGEGWHRLDAPPARLFAQIQWITAINELTTITDDVQAARSPLVIGTA